MVLPSVTVKIPYICLMLMNNFLNVHNDLQEIPLDNVDFSWFTDGSYLKDEKGKYYAGRVIKTPFEIIEQNLATSTQQAELYAIIPACLGQRKTGNIYTDGRVDMPLEWLYCNVI